MSAQDHPLHNTVYITTDGHSSRITLLVLAHNQRLRPASLVMYVLITLPFGLPVSIPAQDLLLAALALVFQNSPHHGRLVPIRTDPSRQTPRHLVPSYRHIRTDFCCFLPVFAHVSVPTKKKGLIAFSGASFALAVWMQ